MDVRVSVFTDGTVVTGGALEDEEELGCVDDVCVSCFSSDFGSCLGGRSD